VTRSGGVHLTRLGAAVCRLIAVQSDSCSSQISGTIRTSPRFRTFAVMLADQVTARQIERVDHMERDDERYPTTVRDQCG
jgi:hypothetical protein